MVSRGFTSVRRIWEEGGGRAYPDVEIEVFICDGLDVESNCWYRCYDFADLGSGGTRDNSEPLCCNS